MKGQINWFAPAMLIITIVLAVSSSMLCKASPPATDAHTGAATTRGVSPAIKEQADRLRRIIWNNTLYGTKRQVQAVIPSGPGDELWEASRAGDPDAMWLVGLWLRLSDDTRAEGLELLEEAAAAGHRSSTHALAVIAIWGDHGELDRARGLELLFSLAMRADPYALYLLAHEEFDRLDLAENAESISHGFRAAADAGVGRAHAMLGVISAKGFGPTPGPEAARAHYERGVAAGDVAAKGLLAIELWNSPASSDERQRAAELLWEAADAGEAVSMRNLGSLLISGALGDRDIERGVRLLEESADAGDREAMRELADRFHQGEGVEKDEARSRLWLHRLARTGDEEAILDAAERELTGRGGEVDAAAGLAWLQFGVDQNSPASMRAMAMVVETGVGTEPDEVAALDWFRKAAEAGDGRACYELAKRTLRGQGVRRDSDGAAEWFARAGANNYFSEMVSLANNGDVVAAYAIGMCYLAGSGVEQSTTDAEHWFRVSSASGLPGGSPDGMHILGRMLIAEDGKATEGIEWLERASERNHIRSTMLLANVYRDGRLVERDFEVSLRWARLAATQAVATVNDAASNEAIGSYLRTIQMDHALGKGLSAAIHGVEKWTDEEVREFGSRFMAWSRHCEVLGVDREDELAHWEKVAAERDISSAMLAD